MIPFLAATGCLIASLVAITLYSHKRARRASSNWHELLARLHAVDRSCLELIALDTIDESGQRRKDENARRLEPVEIWRLAGGLKGLELLEQNSLILIDIAAYIQRWYPEALDAAEELRRNAGEIEWHVSRLRRAQESGKLEGWFANYAQNAIAAYYLMTRRVLGLYESKKLPMLADLEKAL
jgi:hypothetical protein